VLGFFSPMAKSLNLYHDYAEPARTEWVALHECTHLLTFLIDPQYLPQIWLNEAVADYFGSSKVYRDKKGKLRIEPGQLQMDRTLTVQQALRGEGSATGEATSRARGATVTASGAGAAHGGVVTVSKKGTCSGASARGAEAPAAGASDAAVGAGASAATRSCCCATCSRGWLEAGAAGREEAAYAPGSSAAVAAGLLSTTTGRSGADGRTGVAVRSAVIKRSLDGG